MERAISDDFYIELVRHGLEEEKRLNDTLLKLAQKHHVKIVAANNSHYLNEEDAKKMPMIFYCA